MGFYIRENTIVIDCRTCGACCKGFTVDVEAQDEGVPVSMTKEDPLFGLVMRERNGQCIALSGMVGERVWCRIYEDRPQVCRDFFQGCELCHKARELSGLNPLDSPVVDASPRRKDHQDATRIP